MVRRVVAASVVRLVTEERGVVGQRDGPRPREVLLDPGQVAVMLGGGEEWTPVPGDARLDDEE
ncbi:MAG: hypothetical protein AB7F50_03150 [Fimbriimonadaceae bacterium]